MLFRSSPAPAGLQDQQDERWAGPRAALLTALALLTVPWIAFEPEGGAMGVYSDLPLACFFGGGLTLLLQGRPRATDGLAAGLLLAAALLTKNEGLPEALIALALGAASAGLALVRRRRSGRPRLFAVALAGGWVLAAFGLLASWRARIPLRYDEAYFETFSAPSFLHNLVSERTLAALPVIAQRMYDKELWGLFWWLVPVFLLAAAPAIRRPPALLLAVAVAVPLLMVWAAYTQIPSPDTYAAVTWNRILLQVCVPLCGLLALAFRRIYRIKEAPRFP